MLPLIYITSLDSETEKLVLRLPWAGSDLCIDGHIFPAGRIRIVESEIIEVFLDPDRRPGRPETLTDHPAHIGISRPVGIHGEGRNILDFGIDERIVEEIIELVPGSVGIGQHHHVSVHGFEAISIVHHTRDGTGDHEAHHRNHDKATRLFHIK